MLKQYKIVENKLIEDGQSDCPVSVYICPDEKEKKYLIEELKLDEHTVNSALDPNELSRMEFEENHTALIIKRPKRYSTEDNFLLRISSVGLFIFRDRLIILVAEDTPVFEGRGFQKVRSILDLVLKVIRGCVIHFEQHIHVIQMISEELEQKINKSMENKQLQNMFSVEKSLVFYLKAISSNARVIEKLKLNAARVGWEGEDVEFIDDLAIENNQCYEQANTYSQVLSSMMDAWVSVVSNNLNILIKKLTFVMICIMLPNLIVSVFSMNVRLPLAQEGSLVSFWIIVFLAISSAVGVFLFWMFKKL